MPGNNDLVLRLRVENKDLKGKLKESEAQLKSLGAAGKRAGATTASSANAASAGMQRIALRAVAAAGGIYGVVNAARAALRTIDQLNALENRLRLVTESEQDLANVQRELFEISQRSRTGLSETTELYARVAVAAGDLGRSQGDLLQLTELVNKAVALSGATAQESAAGIVQFAQGLASGRLQGDELRSVLENMPALAREIAAGLGVPIGQIRELAAEGKLTADAIINAILSRQGEIEDAYASFVPTVSQSYEQLGSAASRWLQLVDDQVGATEILSSVFAGVAEKIAEINEELERRISIEQTLKGISGGLESAEIGALEERLKNIDSLIERTKERINEVRSRDVFPDVLTGGADPFERRQLEGELARLRGESDRVGAALIRARQNPERAGTERGGIHDHPVAPTEAQLKEFAKQRKLRTDLERAAADARVAAIQDEYQRRLAELRLGASQEIAAAEEKYKALEGGEELLAQHRINVNRKLEREIADLQSAAAKKRGEAFKAEVEAIGKELLTLAGSRADEARQRVEARRATAAKRQTDLGLAQRELALSPDSASLAGRVANAQLDASEADVAAQLEAGTITEEQARRLREIYTREHAQALREIEDMSKPAFVRLADEWRRNAQDMGDTMGNAFAEAMRQGENAFAEFVRTGKLSISSLANTIIDEMSRAFYRQSIAPGLANIGSTIISSLFHSGGVVGADRVPVRALPAEAFRQAPRLHSGGILGAGEVPAVLRRGEGVFTPRQMRALAPAQQGPQKITVEIKNEGTQQQEVVSAQPTFRGNDMVIQVILGDIDRHGQVTQALAGAFGLERRTNG